uniref:Uncharacterized protein n=1 Tax=Anguilla anguilla TaxID=7936 RepID=A0A0E9XIB7_ANGAN
MTVSAAFPCCYLQSPLAIMLYGALHYFKTAQKTIYCGFASIAKLLFEYQ